MKNIPRQLIAVCTGLAIALGISVATALPASATGSDSPTPYAVSAAGIELPSGATAPVAKKVYVCKYVGTPGVSERLQTGNNPIEVSVNAIKGWDRTTIPFPFADAHGKSVVIAFVGGSVPTIADCPNPQGPPPPAIDVCKNISGDQPEVPAGFVADGEKCYEVKTETSPGHWAKGALDCDSGIWNWTRSVTTVEYYVKNGKRITIATATSAETKTTPAIVADGIFCPPAPVVITTTAEGLPNCDTQTVAITTTTTTTPHKWSWVKFEWLLDSKNAVTSSIVTDRALTADEADECKPVIPVKPEPTVVTTTDRTGDCQSLEWVLFTHTLTTDWLYDAATNTWVLGEPVAESVQVRESATAQELMCPTPEEEVPPVVIVPEETTPPVVIVPEEKTPTAETTSQPVAAVSTMTTAPKTLATTGPGNAWLPALIAFLVIDLGVLFTVLSAIKRRKQGALTPQ